MAELVTMPKLGFDMAEGTLVRWVKAEGQPVAKGEILAEIETDKATVEVESQASGIVHKHLVGEKTTVPVGAPIAVISEAGESVDVDRLVGGARPAAAPPSERPSPAAAEPAQALPTAHERTAPPKAAPPERARPAGPSEELPADDGRLPGGVRASPLARRLAREGSLELAQLTGSGPGGRILKRDVEAALAGLRTRAREARPLQAERLPLSKMRSIIGRRMAASKSQIPHFYLTADLDIGRLLDLRQQFNELQPEDSQASINDFLVKAVALALREFPALNASLDGDAIVRHGAIHIGLAVAVEDGLLTVVLHSADEKPIDQIARESREMVARARQGKVRPEDIQGSTFTLSNLGMFGVHEFGAIINPPEAAILAVGAAREEPVVDGGQIRVGRRMKATLSADHRVTDGAEAARWLQVFQRQVEQPLSLLL